MEGTDNAALRKLAIEQVLSVKLEDATRAQGMSFGEYPAQEIEVLAIVQTRDVFDDVVRAGFVTADEIREHVAEAWKQAVERYGKASGNKPFFPLNADAGISMTDNERSADRC